MKSPRLVWVALAFLFVLHNDLWFWNDARLVLGLPVGLLYHLVYCLVAFVLLTWLVHSELGPDTKDRSDQSVEGASEGSTR